MADSGQPSTSGRHDRQGSRKSSAGHLPRCSAGLAEPPVSQAMGLWTKITQNLQAEWSTMRTTNLGVRSGTGVVDELLLRKLHTWTRQLHVLIMTHAAVADAVAKAARQLAPTQLSQLQVMLDTLDHEHLADFLRLSVYNVTSPFAKRPVDVVTDRQWRVGRRRREPTKRMQAAAAASAAPRSAARHASPRPVREEPVRFCGYLPEQHPLVQHAYRIWLTRYPPPPEEDASGRDRSNLQDDTGAAAHAKPRYGSGISLQQEREAMEAERRKPPELLLWTDIERRWQQTCHTTHKHELLNPLMVSPPLPLYTSLPEFKSHLHALGGDAGPMNSQASMAGSILTSRANTARRLGQGLPGVSGNSLRQGSVAPNSFASISASSTPPPVPLLNLP